MRKFDESLLFTALFLLAAIAFGFLASSMTYTDHADAQNTSPPLHRETICDGHGGFISYTPPTLYTSGAASHNAGAVCVDHTAWSWWEDQK